MHKWTIALKLRKDRKVTNRTKSLDFIKTTLVCRKGQLLSDK